MFKFLFINKLKILLRNRALIFWTFLFPFVLGTFFELALSNVGEDYEFKDISLAVIDNDYYREDESLSNVISSLSTGEEKIFDTKYTDLETASKLLEENKIEGYINVDDNREVNVVVLENGLEETIIKYVIDQYYQLNSTLNHAIEYNREAIYNGALELLKEDKNYLVNTTDQKIDFSINYFFTLIAMTCMYGSLIGLEVVKDNEANLSKKGARISISPVNKIKSALAGILAAVLIEFIVILLLLAFLIFVFKVDLANYIFKTLVIIILGSILGVSLGTFVGVSNRKGDGFKTGLLIAVIMLLSFFSGMMGSIDLKLFFDENLPILAKVNPVNIITDGLYYLFAYNTFNAYYNCLFRLSIIILILLFLTFIFVRRKKYDSI